MSPEMSGVLDRRPVPEATSRLRSGAPAAGFVKSALIVVGVGFLGIVVVLPIAAVLVEAFS